MEPERINYRQCLIDVITDTVKESESFFITSFRQLTNQQIEKLRKDLRKSNSKFFVVKKTLSKIALKKIGYENIADQITETCGLTLSGDDAIACSKALMSFKKDRDNFDVICGMYENTMLDTAKIEEFSSIPSREVLLGKLAGTMMAPISNFVRVSHELIAGFVRTVDAYTKKKTD